MIKFLKVVNLSSGKIFHTNSHRLLIDRDKDNYFQNHKKENIFVELDEDLKILHILFR